MIEVCMASFYLTYFLMVASSNLLFLIAVKKSDGDMKALVIAKIGFELLIFFTLPLLMIITKGICNGN